MARKYVRLASPIKKMVKGVGEIIAGLIPVFDYVKFRTTPVGSIPDEVGVESWSAEDRTLQLNLGNDVFYTYGGEIFVDVENRTGSQIDNGSLVMFGSTVGASGNVLAVLAITDGTFPAEYLLGTATENIADNASDGKVTWFGKVRGVDTSAWAKDTILYSDPTVPGSYTDTKPEAPNIKSTIALVLSSGPSGVLLVRPNLLGKLGDLHDVEIATPADLETIIYSATNGRFENAILLQGYKEPSSTLTVTAGAGSFDWGATATSNIINVPTLTQNTVLTITGTLTTLKPITLSSVPDTGGPWTLSYIANGKTKLLTRNGSGTADLETFELWSDGTDVFTADAGGLVWSKGV